MDADARSYSPTGRHRWTRLLGTGAGDHGYDAAADGSGKLYVTGTTDGAFPSRTDPGETDVFL